MSQEQVPNDPTSEDPTSHRSLGMIALGGVIFLVVLGGFQTLRVAQTRRPPPPPALLAARDLIEGAVHHHFRGPPGVGPSALPKNPQEFRIAFPALSIEPTVPADWPGEGWVGTDAAFRPDFAQGALHLRYERNKTYASLFLAPLPLDLAPTPSTYERPGLRVKLLPEANRVALFVEMLP